MRSSMNAWLLIAAACCTRLSANELNGPLAKLDVATGDTIVFLGDSITQHCLYTQYIENYFYTRFPATRLNFHNAGVSGDTTADALARFDRDVAKYRPKYVTILLGMNDGAAKKFDEPLSETYRTDMKRLIEKIRGIGALPILITPTMYDLRMTQLHPKNDSRGRGGYYNGVLAFYGAWLRELAADDGLGFVDMYSPLNQFTTQMRKTTPTFTLIPDGIHPDSSGHFVMAHSLIGDLRLPPCGFAIDVARDENDRTTINAIGGKVDDARFASDGVDFTFRPESLPMPMPTDSAVRAQLIQLGCRMNLETLSVHGLPPGIYRVSINDATIGDYSAPKLASKIEIQHCDMAPQHLQAALVADLNAKRTADAVAPLRNLWRAKKSLARAMQELQRSPNDDAVKRRVKKQEQALVDFDGQIAAFQQSAARIEDEIYAANQPKPLHFRIVRVTDSGR